MDFLLDDCEASTGANLYDILGDLDNQDNNDFTLTPITPLDSLSNTSFANDFLQQQLIPPQVDFSNVIFVQQDSNTNSSHHDSDSGICSDHSPISGQQAYSTPPSSVLTLDNNEQDLVEQIINSNGIDFSQFSGIGDDQSDNANTEQLLNSIEHMLKSMDSPAASCLQMDRVTATNSDNRVKREPNDAENINSGFKKISPKILPKPAKTESAVRVPVIIQPVAGSSTILIENFSSLNSANILSDEATRSPQAKKARSESASSSMVASLNQIFELDVRRELIE